VFRCSLLTFSKEYSTYYGVSYQIREFFKLASNNSLCFKISEDLWSGLLIFRISTVNWLYCYVCKSKAVPLLAMTVLTGRGVCLLLVLDLCTRWGWVVSVTPRSRLPPGEESRYPLVRMLCRPQELVWTHTHTRLKKSFSPSGGRTPVVQSVVTTLYRLSYPTHFCTDWYLSTSSSC
jgi:hypothetical protein